MIVELKWGLAHRGEVYCVTMLLLGIRIILKTPFWSKHKNKQQCLSHLRFAVSAFIFQTVRLLFVAQRDKEKIIALQASAYMPATFEDFTAVLLSIGLTQTWALP